MRKLKPLSLILLLFTIACAYNIGLVKTSYDVLAVSQTAYDTSMKVVADLDSRGLLASTDKGKIIEVASIYHSTHNSAVETLAKYEETKSSADQELLQKQLSLVSEALTNLLTLIKPFLEK